MALLTQNAKMKKSGGDKFELYNFGIPAFRSASGEATCPNAGACAAGCYARQGAYNWPAVKAAYEARYQATKNAAQFYLLMSDELKRVEKRALKLNKQLVIRIHDSGDFYSRDYFNTWIGLIQAFPKVVFYAYTKQVEMLRDEKLPVNFKLNFSFGGKQDKLIRPEVDSNSRVFATKAELIRARYKDTSEDDSHAFSNSKLRKIGLVYHGAKSFKNTKWGGVA
jgi:protein gp88